MFSLSKDLAKHIAHFARALRNHHWEYDDNGGIYLNKDGLHIHGYYETFANDGLGWQVEPNLVVTEGRNHIWEVVIGNDTVAITTWYVAIHSGSATPLATWTAANYASNATELTTAYSESTRVAFTAGTVSAGAVDNSASKAVFTAASASVTINGAALLSSATKGGTSGVLMSASKFAASRTLVEIGDTLTVGYTLTLTSS